MTTVVESGSGSAVQSVRVKGMPAQLSQQNQSGHSRWQLRTSLLLMFASGAAGLVWQMVWTTQISLVLGHEIIAVLSVLAAFFGGLAAGSLLLAHRIEHSKYPGRWYAGLELLIAVWAVLAGIVFPSFLPQLSRWIGAEPGVLVHWSAAFAVPFIALLPATVALGATFPAIERQARALGQQALASAYAANTAGAMAGVLLAVFVFIPDLGLRATTWLFAGVNLACAALAWWMWGRQDSPSHSSHHDAAVTSQTAQLAATAAAVPESAPNVARTLRDLTGRLFLTGLLGVGYEVLAVRVLSQVTENTVYTYALMLAVFLLGTALGAAVLHKLHSGGPVASDEIDRALAALALSVAVSGISLWWADRWVVLPSAVLGQSVAAALLGELAAGAFAMLLPAIVMGALFSLLCLRAQQHGMALGRAVGINTAGAALAPLLFGALLLPQLGAKVVLVLVGVFYLTLRSWRSWNGTLGWVSLLVILTIALLAPMLRFVDLPPGAQVLSYREGVMAAVSVVEDSEGVARLHINNRVQEGTSASGLVETRLAQIPLLLHPAPRNALFLGLGTGYTAQAAALDEAVHVDAVELIPEVIEAAGIFSLKPGAPEAARPISTYAADARRYVQATPQRYDVVVADLFHPARSGAGSLYTVEHFAAVRSRLQPGGLFCQWLALHQMDVQTLRSIVAAFMQVYPEGIAVLASNSLDTPVLGLVARPDHALWRLEDVRSRLQAVPPKVAQALQGAKLEDEYALLGSVIAGPQSLRRFAGDAPVNTDDLPVVAHRAPWINYVADSTPRERLGTLVKLLQPGLEGVLAPPYGPAAQRLQAYWTARVAYLSLGMRVQPHPDPVRMLQQLREPLLNIVAMSPEFRPAAEPLAALAKAVRIPAPDLADQVEKDLQRALTTPFKPSKL